MLASTLLSRLVICLAVMTVSLEAIALPPTAKSWILQADNLESGPAYAAVPLGTVRMGRANPQKTSAEEAVEARVEVARAAERRSKRGAEMILLRAHICRQYKDRGIPPPPRYKC